MSSAKTEYKASTCGCLQVCPAGAGGAPVGLLDGVLPSPAGSGPRAACGAVHGSHPGLPGPPAGAHRWALHGALLCWVLSEAAHGNLQAWCWTAQVGRLQGAHKYQVVVWGSIWYFEAWCCNSEVGTSRGSLVLGFVWGSSWQLPGSNGLPSVTHSAVEGAWLCLLCECEA